jgi:hypothetical protein
LKEKKAKKHLIGKNGRYISKENEKEKEKKGYLLYYLDEQ